MRLFYPILLLGACSVASCALENPFGICNPWDNLAELGVGWCRSGAGASAFDWGSMEPERGKLNFANVDGELAHWLEPHGIKFVGLLGYTAEWASSAPADAKERKGYPPRDLRDWASYIERTARHFGDRISYYEVWNEEDIGFLKGSCNDYCEILKSAYLAVKRGHPRAKVMFGGLAGVNLPYLAECYEHGAQGYFDALAVHPYQWGDTFNDRWFIQQLRDLRELMLQHGDDQQLFLTEQGWESHGTPESEDVQARLIAQCLVTCLTLRESCRLAVPCIFTIKDWGGPGYGLLRLDNSRKPAWVAYQTLARKLADRRCVGALPVTEPLRGYLFAPPTEGNPEAYVAVCWSSDKDRYALTLDVATSRCVLTTMLGETKTLVTTTGRLTLNVGPQPVYVEHLGAHFIAAASPVALLPPLVEPSRTTAPVWLSLDIPEGTRRLCVRRGQREQVLVKLHNDSEQASQVNVDAELRNTVLSQPLRAHCAVELRPWEVRTVELPFCVPRGASPELSSLTIRGEANGLQIPPLKECVRVCDGFAREFLANSWLEEQYLVQNDSGGAPSVRFGGKGWTYKFDLSSARQATLTLHVGAHEAGYWKVEGSADNQRWTVLRDGRSNRRWQQLDLSSYAGGLAYVRISGDAHQAQQVEQVILTVE